MTMYRLEELWRAVCHTSPLEFYMHTFCICHGLLTHLEWCLLVNTGCQRFALGLKLWWLVFSMFCDLICLILTSSVSWNSKNVHQWIDGGFSMDSLIGCRPFRCKVLPQTLVLLFWVCYCSERKWRISVKQASVSRVFIWLSDIPKFYKIYQNWSTTVELLMSFTICSWILIYYFEKLWYVFWIIFHFQII